MADDPTPTPNSPTEPAPTPSDPPAAPPAADPPADPAAPPADDPAATALGGDPEPKADDPPSDDPPAAAVPETYELTAPEGFEKLDADAVALATPVFKELGLSNEQANKLMPVAGQFVKKAIEARDQQFLSSVAEQRTAWGVEAKEDPEIGGAKYDGSISQAAKALELLGFPKGSPFRNLLEDSSLGNHPDMIRAWVRVAKAIGEDSDFVREGADAAVKPKETKEIFWPGQSKPQE